MGGFPSLVVMVLYSLKQFQAVKCGRQLVGQNILERLSELMVVEIAHGHSRWSNQQRRWNDNSRTWSIDE